MSSTEQIFTNATLVLPDETKVGTLVIKDGLIRDISFENTSMPRAEAVASGLPPLWVLPGPSGATSQGRLIPPRF